MVAVQRWRALCNTGHRAEQRCLRQRSIARRIPIRAQGADRRGQGLRHVGATALSPRSFSLRQALPAYSNEIVLAIKGTSLASTIAVMELTGHAKRLMNQNYAIIETFILAGMLYLMINFFLLACVHMLERWLKR
jgi:ABC-type arginine/histidine transport system permease subunit